MTVTPGFLSAHATWVKIYTKYRENIVDMLVDQ